MSNWLLSAAGPRQPDTSWLKADAEKNINPIPENMTDDTSHFEISELKRYALWNIAYMFVTDDTSHLERSELNSYAYWNI